MSLDVIILVLFFIICCILCYFIYAIYRFLKSLTKEFARFNDCFSNINGRIEDMQYKQYEQDKKLSTLSEKLTSMELKLWK